MKASALSAAIPILGRSAEDRKQMKRADPFGLVLRVGSVQQVDLPEPGQAVKDVAPEPQSGPGSEPFAAGRRRWEGCEVQGDLRLVNESWLKLTAASRPPGPSPTTCEARPTDESLITSRLLPARLAPPYGADNGPRLTVWTGSAQMLGQSLPIHCAQPRSAASTAQGPDGAGDDDQGGEERGGCL
jgi:hypothetical protein